MNTPTLSQLADIGAKAALLHVNVGGAVAIEPSHYAYEDEQPAREAFAKAVLDALGYKLPVDPEREAFDAWRRQNIVDPDDAFFQVWKAGREELLKTQALAKEPDTKTEPAWIEWTGGPCPLPDTVKRWEYRCRDGFTYGNPSFPSTYAEDWEHVASADSCTHFVAYRVLDWGTTKQPE